MRCCDCEFLERTYLWNRCDLTGDECYYEFYDKPCDVIDNNYNFIIDCEPIGAKKRENAKEALKIFTEKRNKMTKQEAIKILDERATFGKKEYSDVAIEYIEAFKIAREALKERPNILSKLKEYEDTGLTPEQIRQLKIDYVFAKVRLQELEETRPGTNR